MFRKQIVVIAALIMLLLIVIACNSATPTPVTLVETVVVKETVEVEKPVEVIVTKEIEKEVEKVVTVEVEVEKEVEKVVTIEVEKEVEVEKIVTVEVPKEVQVVQTVEVAVTVTPTPEPTADPTNPKVAQVMKEIAYVQHEYDQDLQLDVFTCASEGGGLQAVMTAPETQTSDGPRYVGPNDGDFSLWGANGLFEIQPDGTASFVPQATGGNFTSPEGIEYERFTLQEALQFFATGDAFWTGEHGAPGRIAECDPQFNEEEEE
jgi:hypothetical protein